MTDETTGARTRKALREPQTSIPWRVLQDDRISFRALGILGELLSRPDDWRTSGTQLARGREREGRNAVETALKELEAVGYLARVRVQDARGRWGWVWVSGDDPAFVREIAAEEVELAKHRDTPPPPLRSVGS